MSAILAPIALIFRRFLFSAGLSKNPHRDNHECCRREDKMNSGRTGEPLQKASTIATTATAVET